MEREDHGSTVTQKATKGNLLQQVVDFINDGFKRIGREMEIPHFERTVYWCEQLSGDCDEALKIAAYAHDAERLVRDAPVY